jgi:hypothetical protein
VTTSMELSVLLAVALCFLASLMVFAKSYIRRARAQSTIHRIGDPAVAHQALIQNADDFANQPASIFPASLAVWRNGERNYNITTADHARTGERSGATSPPISSIRRAWPLWHRCSTRPPRTSSPTCRPEHQPVSAARWPSVSPPTLPCLG